MLLTVDGVHGRLSLQADFQGVERLAHRHHCQATCATAATALCMADHVHVVTITKHTPPTYRLSLQLHLLRNFSAASLESTSFQFR